MKLSDEFLDEVIAEYQPVLANQSVHKAVPAEAVRNSLRDVINGLRAKGVPWSALLPVIGQILTMIFAGTPYGAIIAAILQILGGGVIPAPTP